MDSMWGGDPPPEALFTVVVSETGVITVHHGRRFTAEDQDMADDAVAAVRRTLNGYR